MPSRELKYVISGDARKLQQALKKSENDVSRSQKAMSSAAKKAGGVLAAAFATDKILEFGKASIQTASDVNESISKNRVLFGDYAKSVEQFSDRSAKAYGISKKAALEYTGVFGNLSRAIGVSQKESAGMSVRLVKLAADMASFNNTSIEEALDALRSGLVGESEPLRRFGVTLSAAAVAAEAMRSGIVKVKKESFEYRSAVLTVDKAQLALNESIKKHGKSSIEARSAALGLEKANKDLIKAAQGGKVALTNQQKAAAIMALTFRQTKAAQGDAIKTGDQYAGQQKRLRAQIEDLQLKLGQKLLPIQMKVTKALLSFVNAAQSGKGTIGSLIKAFQVLASVIRPVAIVIAKLIENQIRLAKAFLSVYRAIVDKLLGAFSTMLDAIAKAARAASKIPVIGNKFKGVATEAEKAAGKINDVRKSLDGVKSKTVRITVTGNEGGDLSGRGGGGSNKKRTPAKKGSVSSPGAALPGSVIASAAGTSARIRATTADAGDIASGKGINSTLAEVAWQVQQKFGVAPGTGRYGHKKYTSSGNVSDHFYGNAIDIPIAGAAAQAPVVAWLRANYGSRIKQLLWANEDPTGEHGTHIHLAMAGGGSLPSPTSMGGSGRATPKPINWGKRTAAAVKRASGAAGAQAQKNAAAQKKWREFIKPGPPTGPQPGQFGGPARFPLVGAAMENIDLRVAAGQKTPEQGNAEKIALLEGALPGLSGNLKLSAEGMIRDLKGEPESVAANIGNTLGLIDAQVRAGDMTEAQGIAAKIATIQGNLGNPGLTDRERLDLRGDLNELLKQNVDTQADLAEALNAVKDEMERNRKFAESAVATQNAVAWKALADFLSGQIAGFGGYAGRAATAGAGSTYRL